MGFGMGLLSVACLVLIQESVDWPQRGSATASNLFARNLGSTLGATVLGAVLNLVAGAQRRRRRGHLGAPARRARTPGGREPRTPRSRPPSPGAIHLTFVAMLALSVLIVLMALLVPHTEIGRKAKPAA